MSPSSCGRSDGAALDHDRAGLRCPRRACARWRPSWMGADAGRSRRRRARRSPAGMTVSAPRGIGAPVMMRTAWPGIEARRRTPRRPASSATTSSSRAPPAGMSPLATAYPSTAELSAGGTSNGARISSASTRSRARMTATSSGGVDSRDLARGSDFGRPAPKSWRYYTRHDCDSPRRLLDSRAGRAPRFRRSSPSCCCRSGSWAPG